MGTMEGVEEVIRAPAVHDEKIFVSVRLRPLNEKEILRNDVSDWECISDSTIIYKNANMSVSERSMYPTAYSFDKVFGSGCSTRQVYEDGAKEIALSVVSGINSTVFAYGQTSSGKTHTMTGITEYTLSDIYDYIQKHKEREFLLKFSAMEIYNECVRDLLSPDGSQLRLLDDPERGTIVERLTEEVLRDWYHVIQLLSVCEAQRQIGETSLNEMSSRSHQIIRLTIESSACELLGKENSSTLVSTVNFVDLAGSERASQSLSAGTRLKEGCHINRSLLTLGTVIRKLSKGKNGHIPFRDSKLTRILQSSLGGNARTAIICTMSPARNHAEQSRNTLLFASCAKEVNTNAQVNIVMSEKALVKHLQRELARLESELRNPTSFQSLDYAALLREKDRQIEQLEKEVKDLILQRDISQSQLKDLLQLHGDYGSSLRLGLGYYPHLRVHESPDYENRIFDTSSLGDSQTHSNGISRNSSVNNFIRIPDFPDNSRSDTPSPRHLFSYSNYTDTESYQRWEEMEKRSNGTSEDQCKEVRCIETEDLRYKEHLESKSNSMSMVFNVDGGLPLSLPLPQEKDRRTASPQQREDKEMVLLPLKLKEYKERVSPLTKEEKEPLASVVKEKKELYCINSFNVPSAKANLLQNLTGDSWAYRRLKIPKSRSMTDLSVPIDKEETNESTPPRGSERVFTARPENFNRKPSLLRFDFGVESLSIGDSCPSAENTGDLNLQESTGKSCSHEKGDSIASNISETKGDSRPSAENTGDLELQETTGKSCCHENSDRIASNISEAKEMTDVHHEHQVSDAQIKESEVKAIQSKKSVKDVGLDPIEEEFKCLTSWPTEFKRLQREIIALWDSCNVSLVHRTYFYLLFQGDPTDAIYMEVELRRLLFLKDTFSRGEHTMMNGQTVTLASSKKAVEQERRMLSKQMLKKLTETERKSLFVKWKIVLNSKIRRWQLAHLLWTNTEDMKHIADSAYVVANLVGFNEQRQKAPKEMFGLNFTPRTSKPYSLKRSLISIL